MITQSADVILETALSQPSRSRVTLKTQHHDEEHVRRVGPVGGCTSGRQPRLANLRGFVTEEKKRETSVLINEPGVGARCLQASVDDHASPPPAWWVRPAGAETGYSKLP